jgi:hypothetical protein
LVRGKKVNLPVKLLGLCDPGELLLHPFAQEINPIRAESEMWPIEGEDPDRSAS